VEGEEKKGDTVKTGLTFTWMSAEREERKTEIGAEMGGEVVMKSRGLGVEVPNWST